MIYKYLDYQVFMQDSLANKLAKNSSYSLRAFAKNLEISPSMLSDVLKGKRHFSAKVAKKIATNLKLDKLEARYFCLLVQYNSCEDEEIKSILLENLDRMNPFKIEYQNLNLDHFYLISRWYHIPILELTNVKDYIWTEENVAETLGITVTEAEIAITRLLRMGLIEKSKSGGYKKTSKHFLVSSEYKNESLRQFHAQMLDKAKGSLKTQTPAEKAIGSETICISKKNIDEAKNIIEDCFQRISKLADRPEDKDSVYHLGIQFFNLTANGTQ